ncbi:dihydroceramide delta(4)-desaturase [Polychytrium aggregatum]|uniref:dihydroceramide delta(4)-desaturase n=1 Tax=Polychytrium aggregatum TaxID=110093 RepID=UPI0022FED356|nr:dihydroceramide delta(4)-desaturase [Polychytrium aggregatum]KAI9209624.1 dihydroceramide delta(4)-desaturase [Polychytrium aggregatum]
MAVPRKTARSVDSALDLSASPFPANINTNNLPFKGPYPPTKPSDVGFPTLPKSDDFMWETSDEPHATRRKIILQKYPEINKLMGPCPKTKYSVFFLVTTHFALAYYLRDKMWTLQFWLLAYFVGATMTHSLFLAIHEITHFLAFKSPLYNRLLASFANLPIGFPYWAAFRGYHQEHHNMQGVEGIDTDLPTALEGRLFKSTLGKLFFCTFQILFYALRPMIVKQQKFTSWHVFNWVTQFGAMGAMIYFWGMNPFWYFAVCTFLSGCLHPMSGHFIAEHYVFVKGFETYSYYGLLNLLAYNVGYHNEHHDFPRIPGSRLPEVRRIAAEFYDDLPQVKSWVMTIVNFIIFPHITPYNRVKRTVKKQYTKTSGDAE